MQSSRGGKVGRPAKDISGQRFGRLTVLERDFDRPSKAGAYWICKCECGNRTSVRTGPLVDGQSTSCGCYARELTRARSHSHGMEGTSSYQLWDGMLRRCLNPNHAAYPNYGGRGIGVCQRWMSFENFYSDMGDRPEGMSLDRVDNDKGYSLENCRWASHKQQCRNTRFNRLESAFGETKPLVEWVEQFGMSYHLVHLRLRRGWSVERALLTQPAKRK